VPPPPVAAPRRGRVGGIRPGHFTRERVGGELGLALGLLGLGLGLGLLGFGFGLGLLGFGLGLGLLGLGFGLGLLGFGLLRGRRWLQTLLLPLPLSRRAQRGPAEAAGRRVARGPCWRWA
jgi:hypothetical protein